MLLQRGSTGRSVIKWQRFLLSKGYKVGPIDGIFGAGTSGETIRYQRDHGLDSDGKVGPETFNFARSQGFTLEEEDFPKRPDFPAIGVQRRNALFGSFEFQRLNRSEVRILGSWVEDNITSVEIPSIDPAKVEGFPKSGKIRFHKLGTAALQGFFAEVESEGLTDKILSYAGSFYPRFIRGSTSSLSNHSWGTAFDINAAWNWLGTEPARPGETGCLYELVPIAQKYGFYWGGHFRRRDGMHFELATLDP